MQRLFRITLPLALVLCVACGAKTKPAEQHAEEPKIEELVAELSNGERLPVKFKSFKKNDKLIRQVEILKK